ncbi:MAG: hypothetical protein U0R52_06330 [Solirubrobacterales bacterium]
MRGPRALPAVASCLLLAAAATGCGGGGDTTEALSIPTTPPGTNTHLVDDYQGAERDAVGAAQTYMVAFAAGDAKTVCGLTSLNAKKLAGCREYLANFGPSRQPQFRVASVRVSGDHAQVVLRPTGSFGEPTRFKLRKVGGEWKVIVVSTIQ